MAITGSETTPGPGLRRVPMSWEDFLALPDDVFAEWVHGVVVMSPKPAWRHGQSVARLAHDLIDALPGLHVIAESMVHLPGNRLRGPDVMVVVGGDDTTWVESVPVLVVEVLSPSTRNEDTVVKSIEYAGAGIGQFWVVDPAHRTIDVHVNVDGAWDLVLHLDEAQPAGEVTVGGHGIVPVDLDAVLPL